MSEAAERVKAKRASRVAESTEPTALPTERVAPLMLDAKDERLGFHSLPLSTIVPAGHNARVETDEEKQKELTASVREHGILQPVLVRPMENGTYELVAGWRRWTAAKAAKLSEIPAIVTVAEDQGAHVKGLVENLQREDLDPIDEARAFQNLLGLPDPDGKKLTQASLAKQLGRSQPSISNAMRLLQLPDEVLDKVQTGEMSVGAAKAIVSLPKDQQVKVAREAIKRRMTTSQVESEARYERERNDRAQATQAKEKIAAELYLTTIEAASKGKDKAIGKKTTILVYGERYATFLKSKGVEAGVFSNQEHTLKNGKITCDDDAVLVEVFDYKQPMEARISKVCLVRQHYLDVQAEEKRKALEEQQLQIDTVNAGRKLALANFQGVGMPTESGVRFALYTLLFGPYTNVYGGTSRQHLDAFIQRNAPDLVREYHFPRAWGIWPTILAMPMEKVVYELVAHGLQEVLPNVFADNAERSNPDHYQVREWMANELGIDESLVWGGFEPRVFRTAAEVEDAASEPHEFLPDEVWLAEARASGDTESEDGPLTDEQFEALYADMVPCRICGEAGDEVPREFHDEAMRALTGDDPQAPVEPDVEPDAEPSEDVTEAEEAVLVN
jgi:ParB family chromosome partitioning protein